MCEIGLAATVYTLLFGSRVWTLMYSLLTYLDQTEGVDVMMMHGEFSILKFETFLCGAFRGILPPLAPSLLNNF